MAFFQQGNNNSEPENNENNQETQKKGGNRGLINLLIGGYLIYTGYKLFRDVIAEGNVNEHWYFLVFGGAFAIFGIYLLIRGIKSYGEKVKKDKADYDAMLEEEQREFYESARSLRTDDMPENTVEEDEDDIIPIVGADGEVTPCTDRDDTSDDTDIGIEK